MFCKKKIVEDVSIFVDEMLDLFENKEGKILEGSGVGIFGKEYLFYFFLKCYNFMFGVIMFKFIVVEE